MNEKWWRSAGFVLLVAVALVVTAIGFYAYYFRSPIGAISETNADWGIFGDYFLARDGSGLSRYDYLSADALTWLLTYLWMDPKHAEPYRAALPVFGVSGNVANRLKNTPASGRVWAKTGSMSQVRSLSGYIVTSEGEPLVFAFIVNGFRVPQREIDAAIDRALLRLVEFKHASHFP